MHFKIILTFLAISASVCASDVIYKDTTIVKTESGPIKGYLRDGDNLTKYYTFLGVPYSKQPVGDLRLKPLEPPDKWSEVYEAKTEKPMCIQRLKLMSPEYLQKGNMSEACLGANIHVPANRKDGKLLPVLVYIFGAGFNFFSAGTDVYGPEYLVAKDVVVITFNYRINLFGFLSLNTTEASSNLSIKDMIFFLKWVQTNIASFGGNPNEVTLGGWSSGASSTHLLMLTPSAKGLFHRVIMQSGNALGSYMLIYRQYQDLLNTELRRVLRLEGTNDHELFQIITKSDTETLRVATDTLLDQFAVLSFTPAIEPNSADASAVVTEEPFTTMKSGQFIDVPQLIGFTTDEALFFEFRMKATNILERLKLNPTLIVPPDILITSKSEKVKDLIQIFQTQYFQGGKLDNLSGFENLISDSFFKYPTLRYADFSAQHNKSPTYMYEFSFTGKNNLFSQYVARATRTGAAHGDDIDHLFKANFFYGGNRSLERGSKEELTKDRMVEMFSNFIKYGNPTPEVKSDRLGVKWPTVDKEKLTYLQIGSELKVKTDPYPELRKFYNQFYPLKPLDEDVSVALDVLWNFS